MKNEGRKIALVLDNCPAHPTIQGLTHVKLVFLPPNTTAKSQPMDAGVIRCMKAHYRKLLAKEQLVAHDLKLPFTISVLDAMRLLKEAWKSVTAQTIQNCFKHVGFEQELDVEETDVVEEEEEEEMEGGMWERLQWAPT